MIDVSLPSIRGSRVLLRPIDSSDMRWLYLSTCSGDAQSLRWRFRGQTPSPASFEPLLWAGVDVQFVMASLQSGGEPIGLVQLFNYEKRDSYAYLSVFIRSEYAHQGWPLEGLSLFVRYCYEVFPIRKLYLETTAYNASQFSSSIGPIFEEEGRLKDHAFMAGEYHDLLILSLSRDRWNEIRSVVLPDSIRAHSTDLPT